MYIFFYFTDFIYRGSSIDVLGQNGKWYCGKVSKLEILAEDDRDHLSITVGYAQFDDELILFPQGIVN